MIPHVTEVYGIYFLFLENIFILYFYRKCFHTVAVMTRLFPGAGDPLGFLSLWALCHLHPRDFGRVDYIRGYDCGDFP